MDKLIPCYINKLNSGGIFVSKSKLEGTVRGDYLIIKKIIKNFVD